MTTYEFKFEDNPFSIMPLSDPSGPRNTGDSDGLYNMMGNSSTFFQSNSNKTSQAPSPAPPSIVSMTNDAFEGGMPTGNFDFASSMSDLFEGVLCDDELTDMPAMLNGATEQMPQPTPMNHMQGNATVVSATSSSNKNKRCQKKGRSSGPNKRSKTASGDDTGAVSNGTPPNVEIAPLTDLPASSEVHSETASFNKNGVDTTTAHIKALTGANGAAVCLHAIELAVSNSNRNHSCASSKGSTVSSLSDGSADNKEGEMTAADKAKQSRDRNRQHARNTRVRKKAYLEELKRTLNELVEERDQAEYRRLHKERSNTEQRDVRYRVLVEFLRLRGQNEADPARWGLILEDEFSFVLPRTDIPGVVCSSGHLGAQNEGNDMCQSYPLGTSKKQLKGVNQVMEDSATVTNLLQSLGAGVMNSSYTTAPLSMVYECDHSSFMMDGSNVAMKWTATSSGAISKGANAEFSIQGTLTARFNPKSNKLVSIEFSF